MAQKKPRYSKQKDEYSCGPYAILNTLKWLGLKAPEKKMIPKLTVSCKCKPAHGTHNWDLTQVLNHYDRYVSSSYYINPNIYKIAEHLECKDTAAIVVINWWEKETRSWCGHFALLTKVSRRGFTGINYVQNKTIKIIPWKVLKKDLDNTKRMTYAWLLTKR